MSQNLATLNNFVHVVLHSKLQYFAYLASVISACSLPKDINLKKKTLKKTKNAIEKIVC